MITRKIFVILISLIILQTSCSTVNNGNGTDYKKLLSSLEQANNQDYYVLYVKQKSIASSMGIKNGDLITSVFGPIRSLFYQLDTEQKKQILDSKVNQDYYFYRKRENDDITSILVMPVKPEDAGFIINRVDNIKKMMNKTLMVIDKVEKNSSADKNNVTPGSIIFAINESGTISYDNLEIPSLGNGTPESSFLLYDVNSNKIKIYNSIKEFKNTGIKSMHFVDNNGNNLGLWSNGFILKKVK